MNILFLSAVYSPYGGGGEFATYLYAKLLSRAGLNIIVVTNRFAGEPEVSRKKNLTVYRIPLFQSIKGAKYSVIKRPDILLSSFMRKMMKWTDVVYIPRYLFSAIPFIKAYKKPIVVHVHGYLPICPLGTSYDISKGNICNRGYVCSPKCIYAYEQLSGGTIMQSTTSIVLNMAFAPFFAHTFNLSDAIICVSESQRKILTSKAPGLYDKTHVIYNPIPELSYTAIEGDDFGYFGGSNPLKGFHVLYHALAYAHVNKSNVALKVHAAGMDDFVLKCVKEMERFGIIAYEKLDRVGMERIYKQILGVVVPSLAAETFSYVALEASLKGRVVIASNLGALPEVLNGCPGVFYISPGDHKQLADKMIEVKNMSNEAVTELGLRNREVISRKFNNEQIIRQFINVLSSLI
jgi:glycosyltransferase involved in cell wall biosynthesis